ncbi:MAG TPA: thioredoxin [Holophaga sp.]|nr:thioredoxin [Holophaga sp.]
MNRTLILLVPALAAFLACDRGTKASSPAAEASASPVQVLTAASFPGVRDQSKPVLVDFWAPWCGPCRTQGPIVDEVAGRIGDAAVVGKVNVDDERDLAAQYGVQAIPTLVVLKNGQVVNRFVGVQTADVLVNALNAAK